MCLTDGCGCSTVRGMKRTRRASQSLAVVLALMLLTCVGVALIVWTQHTARRTPVYTVQQFLEGGHAFHMRPGQVAWVRGSIACLAPTSPTCLIEGPASDSPGGIGLMVYRESAPPLVAALRRIAFLAPLIPPTAATPLAGRKATYRVQFVGCPSPPACPTGMTQWRLGDGGTP